MKKLTILVACLLAVPLVIYLAGYIIKASNRVNIKDGFYIEYLELYASISLCNDTQGFVGGIKEAYWNTDSLVVSGAKGCFLLVFGKTKYNDEMVEIDCNQLRGILKNKPIEEYIKK